MEFQLRTLTPLWTGGVQGKVDRIHESGILGSLRWWYEVMVRGLGGEACDPSKGECAYDEQKYRKSSASNEYQRLRDAGLCDVCQVFGATGWRRRFRLMITEDGISDAGIQHPIKAERTYTDNRGNRKTPTWYFPDPTRLDARPTPPNTPKQGMFQVHIQSLHPAFPPEVIGGLIQFMADWAALGARPQMGFGVIEPQPDRLDTQMLYERVGKTAGAKQYPTLPSLQNIFLAQIDPKDANQSFTDQDTFNLKYDVRQLFSGHQNRDLRHFLMGTVKGERIASKVKMSRPYDSSMRMRVWGWIPEEARVYRNGWSRERVVEKIHDHLNTSCTLHVWREMNSTRDTIMPNNGDAKAFLRSLLGLEGDDEV